MYCVFILSDSANHKYITKLGRKKNKVLIKLDATQNHFFLLKTIRECVECTYIESINYFHAIKHGSDNESGARISTFVRVGFKYENSYHIWYTLYYFPFPSHLTEHLIPRAQCILREEKKTHAILMSECGEGTLWRLKIILYLASWPGELGRAADTTAAKCSACSIA